MKALIIGGGGFVGPYLVNHLHDDLGYEVAVTKTAKEQLALSNAVVYDCDILNKSEITDVLETVRPDYIFHLAAQSSVSVSWKNPALTIDVNIKGAVNMLDAVRELDYKPRVLLIGSGEEYGHIRLLKIRCFVREISMRQQSPARICLAAFMRRHTIWMS